MEEDTADGADVLKLTQEKGYAEADPAMDVDGTDATQKLVILANLGFGVWVPGQRRGAEFQWNFRPRW